MYRLLDPGMETDSLSYVGLIISCMALSAGIEELADCW